jgi:hypothetical protein
VGHPNHPPTLHAPSPSGSRTNPMSGNPTHEGFRCPVLPTAIRPSFSHSSAGRRAGVAVGRNLRGRQSRGHRRCGEKVTVPHGGCRHGSQGGEHQSHGRRLVERGKGEKFGA